MPRLLSVLCQGRTRFSPSQFHPGLRAEGSMGGPTHRGTIGAHRAPGSLQSDPKSSLQTARIGLTPHARHARHLLRKPLVSGPSTGISNGDPRVSWRRGAQVPCEAEEGALHTLSLTKAETPHAVLSLAPSPVSRDTTSVDMKAQPFLQEP